MVLLRGPQDRERSQPRLRIAMCTQRDYTWWLQRRDPWGLQELNRGASCMAVC
jgi:hypothetical protein